MTKHGYPIVIAPLSAEDGGGYIAYAPDLRGCMSDGETREEAARNIEDAIEEWLEEAKEASIEIPEPFSASRLMQEKWKELCEAVKRQDSKIGELEEQLTELFNLLECFEDNTPTFVKLPPVHVASRVRVAH
jgi:predicted RNase H-like HicB family nuclease